jgi:HEAT repeat protein
MSDDRLQPDPIMSESAASPPRSRRLQTSVRTLIALVACCGVLLWAARIAWESQHPAIAAAQRLKARSAFERVEATRQLGQLGLGDASEAIPPLIAALNDADPEVRVAAAEALNPVISNAVANGTAPTAIRDALTGLQRALRDRDADVRIAAASVLGFISQSSGSARVIDIDTVVSSLASSLSDPEENARLALISALAGCGPHVTVAPPRELIAAMKDKSARNRAAAVSALARFPCSLDPWVPSLLRILEQDEPQVRDACGWALNREKPPAFTAAVVHELIEALEIRNRYVRYFSARALLPHTRAPETAAAIPGLLSIVHEMTSLNQDVRGNKGDAFEERPLDHDPVQVAIVLLGRLAAGKPSADTVIAALCEVAGSGHSSQRSAAAYALGEFGPTAEPAIPALISVLKQGPIENWGFFQVDDAMAWALARIAPGTSSADNVVAVLSDALHSRSRAKRLASVVALPKFGASAVRTLPRLRELQNDRDTDLQAAAAKAVAAIEAAM